MGTKLKPYKCKVCEKYHLTKKKREFKMKNFCILFVLVFFLSNCVTTIETTDVSNLYQTNTYVKQNVKYVSDEKSHQVKDYWQSTTETLNLHTGDCEDFAILQAYILHEKYKIPKSKIKYGYFKNSIEEHLVVVYNNQYILDYDNVYPFDVFYKNKFVYVRSFDYDEPRVSKLYKKL